jgi:hypothetical protein
MPTKIFGTFILPFRFRAHHFLFILLITFHLRLPRATTTQEISRSHQYTFHLQDGPEQQARDDAMRQAMVAELEGKLIPTDGNPNQWGDHTKTMNQFGYDAYAEVERWWMTGGGREHMEALANNPSHRDDNQVGGQSPEIRMKSLL